MKLLWRCCLLLTFSLASFTPMPQAQTEPLGPTVDHPEAKAELSDMTWLQLVDTGKYAESWKTASAAFQAAVTEEKWAAAMKSVREPLGKLVARHLASSKYSKTLPGVPDGEYVVTLFETSFEHKQSAQETVVSQREADGNWRLAGYYIK